MTMRLERVEITGLFGIHDVDVPIVDNALVLVGENGTGKSTFISLIYFALTGQWDRLSDLPFKSCALTIDGERFHISRAALSRASQSTGLDHYLRRRLGPERAARALQRIMSRELSYWLSHKTLLQTLAPGVPLQVLIEYRESQPETGDHSAKLPAARLRDAVRDSLNAQVLFLPTYRRIEKDLRVLLPDLDLDEAMAAYRKARGEERDREYVELVEFGMTDIQSTLNGALEEVGRHLRGELNRLTGEYLRDVIRGEHRQGKPEELASPEVAHAVEAALERIDDAILPQSDRASLHELLGRIQEGYRPNDEEKVVAHFLAKLVDIQKKQQTCEQPLRDFAAVVNKNYLSDKAFFFDPRSFEMPVRRLEPMPDGASQPGSPIPLQGLSSGEKQLVSLFSHIYLSVRPWYFVLIDEPELSISVPWQRTLLTDIRATGRCAGLLAVTHSPFIFENDLGKYAHSMHEYLRPTTAGKGP